MPTASHCEKDCHIAYRKGNVVLQLVMLLNPTFLYLFAANKQISPILFAGVILSMMFSFADIVPIS